MFYLFIIEIVWISFLEMEELHLNGGTRLIDHIVRETERGWFNWHVWKMMGAVTRGTRVADTSYIASKGFGNGLVFVGIE